MSIRINKLQRVVMFAALAGVSLPALAADGFKLGNGAFRQRASRVSSAIVPTQSGNSSPVLKNAQTTFPTKIQQSNPNSGIFSKTQQKSTGNLQNQSTKVLQSNNASQAKSLQQRLYRNQSGGLLHTTSGNGGMSDKLQPKSGQNDGYIKSLGKKKSPWFDNMSDSVGGNVGSKLPGGSGSPAGKAKTDAGSILTGPLKSDAIVNKSKVSDYLGKNPSTDIGKAIENGPIFGGKNGGQGNPGGGGGQGGGGQGGGGQGGGGQGGGGQGGGGQGGGGQGGGGQGGGGGGHAGGGFPIPVPIIIPRNDYPYPYPGGQVIVTQPAPVYESTAVPADPIRAEAPRGSVDLVLEDVQLEQPATLIAGPAYRLTFRNQGTQDAGPFRLAAFASYDGTLTPEHPKALVDVLGLRAGEADQVVLRMPLAAMQMNAGDSIAPFNQLVVVIDLDSEVEEIDETNNVVRLPRTALEPAVD